MPVTDDTGAVGKRSRRQRPPVKREDAFGPPPDITDLLARIVVGELDDHLYTLGRALNARLDALHQAQAMLAAATLDVGHRVRIGHSVRPLYLHGRTGTITAWAGKSAVVLLEEPVGRYVTGELRCPPAALEPLGPE